MDHKEMSRRTLAVVFVWGFWLLWIIAGIACLTTHEHEVTSGRIVGGGRVVGGPEYDCTGLAGAIFIWLIVSSFPMVFEQWKYRKVGRRCFYEFTLSGLAVVLVIIPLVGLSDGEAILFGCSLLMAGLSYSCFRLRQVGLDYLEPLQGADQQDIEKGDDPQENAPSSATTLMEEEQQQTEGERVKPSAVFSRNATERPCRKSIVHGMLLVVAWLLLLFQAAGLVGIVWARYPRDPAISLLIYHWKHGHSYSLPSDASVPSISQVTISAVTFLAGINQFALATLLISLGSWCYLRSKSPRLANIAGITALGSLLTVAMGVFIAFLPN